MRDLKDIAETKFIKDLLKDPKPVFLPYFKSDGPIIDADNQSSVVEALMMDYLKKKLQITHVFKDYEKTSVKTDLEVLQQFEKDVEERIGSRIRVMHFYMYDPAKPLEQLESVILEKDFESWAIE